MTLPLRAFLMLRSAQGEWAVTVYRDLDSILRAWADRAADINVGVLHIGFDRPASVRFDEVASKFNTKMLLTAAAKDALPRGFEAHSIPVGIVDEHPIYLALRGWGYVTSSTDLPAAPLPSHPIFEPKGWVKEFLRQYSELSESFLEANIVDDESYLTVERTLERSARYHSGLFRYRAQVRPNTDDPCEVVRAAPPWLLERSFSTIELTVRVANAFTNTEIRAVRDLLPYDVDGLLHISNFGRKSVRDLHEALILALNEGPYDLESGVSVLPSSSLMQEVGRALAGLDERAADIVKRRMGFGVPSETLHEIGVRYGVTRERIRQIEAKSLVTFANAAIWGRLLTTKLESLLLGREFPLPVLGLEAVDIWLSGVSKCPDALKYLLANLCGGRFAVVRIDGIEYVGRITQDEWTKALREARHILATGANERWSEEHCKSVVSSVIGENRREFRSVFWNQASLLCHFVEIDSGELVLASYGRGAEQAVEAVLLDADEPLHYSEIATRAAARSGKEVDIRRAQNAAAAIGVLLGRGIYGLDRHIKLAEHDGEVIRDQLEQVILDGPDDRQWHTSELLAIAAERSLPGIALVDKYVLDNVLSRSQSLRSLGRMTWSKSIASSIGRIDVRQAVVAVLQQAGGPLTTNEIRQRLVALRGVGQKFQVYSSEAVVRVDSERWGLNDRDISLKRDQQPALLNYLEKCLRQRDKGIHISEAIETLFAGVEVGAALNPETIFSIATTDVRFQLNLAQYVFLREWGDSRRETLAGAALETLRVSGSPLRLSEIMEGIERLTLRTFDKRVVVSALHAIEATFEAATDKWSPPSPEKPDEISEDGSQESYVSSAHLLGAVEWR